MLPSLTQAATSFLPHGYCISWQPALLWTLVGSDVLIALSYFTIPLALYLFARKQAEMPFPMILVLFGVFILACGVTHVLEVMNIWRPIYHISAGVKAFTAIVSVITALAIWPLLREVSGFFDERVRLQQALLEKNRELEALLQLSKEAKSDLARSEQAFRSTVMAAPIGMAMVSPQGVFVMVNRALCEMLGYSSSELVKLTFQEITHPEDLDADLLHVSSLLDGLADSYRMEKRYLHRDGRIVYVQLDVVLIRDQQNQASHFISQIQDVTSRKKMELALMESRHRYRALLDNLPTAVVVHQPDSSIEYANAAAEALLGLPQQGLLNKCVFETNWKFIREDGSSMDIEEYPVMQVSASKSSLRGYVTGLSKGKGQAPLWMLVNGFPVLNTEGELDRIIISFIDITERKQLEMRLVRHAGTDPLTGLSNRRQFDEDARKEIARHSRSKKPLSLMMLDLDHFKRVNDQFGHEVGDALLCLFSDLCRRELREHDIACRLGGEEFAVLMPDTDLNTAVQVAERLRLAIAEACLPVPEALPVMFTVSIGIAELNEDDRSIKQLLKRADMAMYQAKDAGRNRVEFSA